MLQPQTRITPFQKAAYEHAYAAIQDFSVEKLLRRKTLLHNDLMEKLGELPARKKQKSRIARPDLDGPDVTRCWDTPDHYPGQAILPAPRLLWQARMPAPR
jgi:hypothetical protein